MISNDEELLKLAAAVADAEEVDWASVEALTGGDSTVVRELRALSELVAVHRSIPSVQAAPADTGVPAAWGDFDIRREIGRGAYGTVYLAWDPSLECEVALKLLRTPPTADRASVLREGRLLARINHANVVRVFRIVQSGDDVGLVMECIEGTTLKGMLIESGPRPAREAALIGIDLCSAVAAVHKAGLIHRDIKSQNVMRAVGGRIVLMDFGGVGDLDDVESYASTLHGTPLYLAPEILEGRSASLAGDIYAVGVLLFNLVSGRFPYEGTSIAEIRRAHRQGGVVHLDAVRRDLPAAFVEVVTKALHRDPAARYRSATAMREALIRSLGEGDMPAHLFALRRPPARSDLPSVAVLPFLNLRRDPEMDYFCDGLAEELLTTLGKVDGLRVVSRLASFQYRGHHADIRAVSQQLQAATVLEGTVSRAGDQLRVTARLVNGTDGFALWSESYRRPMDDVFVMQDDIAARVAERFMLSADAVARHAESQRHTDNPRAYHLYLKGRYNWSRRYHGGLATALDCFQRAIVEDAGYSLAHAGLADVFSFLGLYSIRKPRDVFALAERAAQRALEIDPHSPEVQTSLALLAIGRDWNLPEAIRRLTLAVELDHGQVQSRIYHAWLLVLLGELDAALNLAHDAQELDPTSLLVTSGVAYTCFLARAYSAGVEACERSLEQDPDFIIAMYVKGMCRAQQGEFGEAIQLLERAAAMSGRAPFYVGLLGNFYGRGGRRDAALRVLAELTERSATQYVPPHAFAYVHAGLEDLEAAFAWQARACDDGASPFNYFSPVIENMHGDPRHVADMFRMGWQRWPGGSADPHASA